MFLLQGRPKRPVPIVVAIKARIVALKDPASSGENVRLIQDRFELLL